jgi:hypothetical protein
MDNAADYPAVINPSFATGISWKKRLKPRKLVVIQPKTVPNHCWSPFGDRESQNRR